MGAVTFRYLPNVKMLDLSKSKSFTDDKSNIAKMVISVRDRLEKNAKKGENVATNIFAVSFNVFKSLSLKDIKNRDF